MATKAELLELFKQGEKLTGDNFKKLIEFIPDDLSQAQKDFLYSFVDAMPEENGVGDLTSILIFPEKVQVLDQFATALSPEDQREAFFQFIQSINQKTVENIDGLSTLMGEQIDPLTMTTMTMFNMVMDTRTKLGEIEQRLQALEAPAE